MESTKYYFGEIYPKKQKQEGLLLFDESIPMFHIGQCYEKVKAKPIKCGLCGGNHFHVGQGEYYTAIRCVNCNWETCIHSG